MLRRSRGWLAVALLVGASCRSDAARFPWNANGGVVPVTRAGVRTLNARYDRTRSSVLVREVDSPSRAALDYAAYHANFMITELPPEGGLDMGSALDLTNPFRGAIDRDTLTADVRTTPLTEDERSNALAFAPAVEFLASRRVPGAEALADAGAAVREETWGLHHGPEAVTQSVSDLYLHSRAERGGVELWAKIEFAPWFAAFHRMPDQDGDGVPEVYGRIRQDFDAGPLSTTLHHEYMGEVLGPAGVKAWANQLSSYWYPSFNTDLVAPGPSWPDERTEAAVRQELGGAVFAAPRIVLRGKPQGKPTYDVFLVRDASGGSGASGPSGTAGGSPAASAASGQGRSPSLLQLPATRPTPHPDSVAAVLTRELSENGGTWAQWTARVGSFQDAVRRRLRSTPAAIKAFAGADGFLLYRGDLEFVASGDLEKQRAGKNPLPVILEFKKLLDAHGVDFLFVPIPTKEEIFPEAVDPAAQKLVGQVVQPYSRKFLLALAQAGVEVVDLWTPFLATRREAAPAGSELLYQHQDTHWTDRGLRLAAEIVSSRIRAYPWFSDLAAHARRFEARETTFTRFGDLHSRLPDPLQAHYTPETLVAHPVVGPDGAPYDDDPDSPVVVLGDSFTGVYELTDAEHAGVSAHIAKGISYPVDLVMSYGGGPNVRFTLLRRGEAALNAKKLVVWMMTARDLYGYAEDWEPLPK
jgi:alginate O-acetyltransferase complex protein AlgJ